MAVDIKRLIEKSGLPKKIEEKSTLGLFFAILTGIVVLGGFVGKIFDLDKPIALFLSHAIVVDATTKAPELKLWFVPILLLALLISASLILMVIWTVKNHFYQTKDQNALEELMGAVRQIRDQAKQTKIKAWESLTFIYLINKDFSGSQSRISVMKAVDLPVHFWESVNNAEDEADSVRSLAEVNYKVRDLSSPQNNIVYLPSENGQRCKKACLFFLPPIQPGQSRKFEISFQWPGLFRRLKKTSEDFEFTTSTREILSLYRVEIYLQEGTGSSLDCEITGDQHASQSLRAEKYESNGWSGYGFVYQVTDLPAGNLRLVLKAKLKS